MYGDAAKNFDWDNFWKDATTEQIPIPESDREQGEPTFYEFRRPADPYLFVDDQLVNGRILCKAHHTGKDEGIHDMPFPLWIAQRYLKEGYQFTPSEKICHEEF
jgi:hypothetical protein